MWAIGWNRDFLASLKLARLSIDQVAESAALDIERLGLVEVVVVRRGCGARPAHARVWAAGPEDLAGRERAGRARDRVCLEVAIEKVPGAISVNSRTCETRHGHGGNAVG